MRGYRLQHGLDVLFELRVAEAQDVVAMVAEPTVAAAIRSLWAGVVLAIEFYDQLPLEADEVDDIGADWLLPPEVAAVELLCGQAAPRQAFERRRFSA
jgi:hypothetical protein